jgi:2-haloacid dehalogenase
VIAINPPHAGREISWVQRLQPFDVYGTLVNLLARANPFRSGVGDLAGRFAELWRMKQLEYSFVRARMRSFQPLLVCSRQALVYTERALGMT